MKNSETTMPTSSKIIFDESEEDESSSYEEAKIERELADIPFGELQKARSDGTLSLHQNSNPQKTLAIANKNRFKKRYNFLYEEQLPAGKEELQKHLKKSKDPEVIAELKSRIYEISTKNVESQILTAHKKKERVAAKQGKQPFYRKKSEVMKRKLIQKYESLKDAGKLDAYIEKRRKRHASKDHRFMPYRMPGNNE